MANLIRTIIETALNEYRREDKETVKKMVAASKDDSFPGYKGGSPSKFAARVEGRDGGGKEVRTAYYNDKNFEEKVDKASKLYDNRIPGSGNIAKGTINTLAKSKHECAGMF